MNSIRPKQTPTLSCNATCTHCGQSFSLSLGYPLLFGLQFCQSLCAHAWINSQILEVLIERGIKWGEFSKQIEQNHAT